MDETRRHQTTLEARRLEILRLIRNAEESTKPVELDQASIGRLSRIDAMQQQAMALASARRRQQELVRIDSALRRIEDGEYGWCISCGEEIAPRRLELDPAVPTCVRCA